MLKFEYESPLTQHHQKNLRRGLQLSMKNTLILLYQGTHVPLGTMPNVFIVEEVMDPVGSIFPIHINHFPSIPFSLPLPEHLDPIPDLYIHPTVVGLAGGGARLAGGGTGLAGGGTGLIGRCSSGRNRIAE